MDVKRLATIIGVGVIGFIGYYIVYYAYNLLEWLIADGNGSQTPLAILTSTVVAIIYTVKTRRQ